MFEEEFCLFLEFRICELVKQLDDDDLKGYWCDGVRFVALLDDTACFIAHFGKCGQAKYYLFLQLGEKSRKLLDKGKGIIDCIPSIVDYDNFSVDVARKQIFMDLS